MYGVVRLCRATGRAARPDERVETRREPAAGAGGDGALITEEPARASHLYGDRTRRAARRSKKGGITTRHARAAGARAGHGAGPPETRELRLHAYTNGVPSPEPSASPLCVSSELGRGRPRRGPTRHAAPHAQKRRHARDRRASETRLEDPTRVKSERRWRVTRRCTWPTAECVWVPPATRRPWPPPASLAP